MQELEAVKGKVEQLTGERDKAMAENVMVRQQRDCHANHCQLLTRDNKRLHTQLQTLRAEKSATEPLLVSTESRPVYSNIGKKSRAQTGRLSGGAQPADANQGNAAKSANSNPSRSFKGEDVQNTLHKDPFDLSKRIGKMSKTKFDSKSVLEQVQQLRSAVP